MAASIPETPSALPPSWTKCWFATIIFTYLIVPHFYGFTSIHYLLLSLWLFLDQPPYKLLIQLLCLSKAFKSSPNKLMSLIQTREQNNLSARWSTTSICKGLNEYFPGQWIGGGSSESWPPWSLDLTPQHLYLWDNVKQGLMSVIHDDMDQVKWRIRHNVQSVTPDALTWVRQEVEHQWDACREMDLILNFINNSLTVSLSSHIPFIFLALTVRK
jgi:hypothetical protein